MSLSSAIYYFATCAGKSSNLRNPRCLIEGPGSFDESEATNEAIAEGWSLGTKNYCPAHLDQAPALSTDAAAAPVKRRGRKAAETPADVQVALEHHE